VTKILKEFNFTKGIRGKYAQAYKEGVKIIKLDTVKMKFFLDAKAVNKRRSLLLTQY